MKKALVIIYYEIRHWIFQGGGYLDWQERKARIYFETLIFLISFLYLQFLIDLASSATLSILIAHTQIWLLLGNHMVVLKVVGLTTLNETKIAELNAFIKDNAESRLPADAKIVIFGSMSRNEIDEKSDIDLRIISGRKTIDILTCLSILISLKLFSLRTKIPLDAYLISDETTLARQIRKDEKPIVVARRD